MILDLREFDEFPARKTIEAGPGALKPFADTIISVDGACVSVDIQKAGEEFYCQAEVTVTATGECARCLTQYQAELVGKTNFIICSDTGETRQRALEDNEEYVFFKGTDLRVDITEPVRQTAILSLSLKPLCDEDCRGLCAQCGQNLNERSCDCVKESTDPRWEGLRDLPSE
ncbi:MAG: DUF177 domain-containing protein [bacterium]|nr:DUF177 domain-containing protein [bacterium]